MTGNSKYNKKFEIESSGPEALSEPASEPTTDPDSDSGELSGPHSGLPSGPKVDESSVMVSGMVPLVIEFEGKPIWISTDLNSKRAFRPSRVKFEVSFEYLLMCGDCQIIVALALRNSSSCH